jgi:hypothetical protein
MQLGLWRIWLLCTLGCSAGCAGATARIAGWYVTRQIDGYFDLTSEQKDQVRLRVDELIAEIRSQELPQLLYLMRLVRDAIAEGEVPQRIADLQARSDLMLDRAAERLIPELAWLMSQLDDRQIAHLEAKMRASVDKIYEDQKLAPAERREKLDGQLVESLEKVVGDLSDGQRRTILTAAHALPDDRSARYRFDLARIYNTAKFLRTHPPQAAIEAELARLWRTRDDLGAGRDKRQRREEQQGFLLTIDRTLDPEQRRHAVEKLNAQIRSLARFALPHAPKAPAQTAQNSHFIQ